MQAVFWLAVSRGGRETPGVHTEIMEPYVPQGELPYPSSAISALRLAVAARLPGDGFWAVFASRLALAYLRLLAPTRRGGETESGAWRPKTRPEYQCDLARWEGLAWTAADHPLQPLGATESAVRDALHTEWESIVDTRATPAG